MIRVLVQKPYNEKKTYFEFAGVSTDSKPTDGVLTGSIFEEVDTGRKYRYNEESEEWFDTANASKTPITGATVTLGSALVYTGSELTQAVSSVVLGSTTLTENTDYKVKNNKEKLPGTYTLRIVGIGSYSGSIDKEFTVGKGVGSVSVSPSSLSLTAEGDAGTSTLSVTGDGAISVTSSAEAVATAALDDSTVSVTPLTEGTATVTVTLAEGDLFEGDTATISITVEAA